MCRGSSGELSKLQVKAYERYSRAFIDPRNVLNMVPYAAPPAARGGRRLAAGGTPAVDPGALPSWMSTASTDAPPAPPPEPTPTPSAAPAAGVPMRSATAIALARTAVLGNLYRVPNAAALVGALRNTEELLPAAPVEELLCGPRLFP